METKYNVTKVENGFLVETTLKVKDPKDGQGYVTLQWVAMNIDQLAKLFTHLYEVPK